MHKTSARIVYIACTVLSTNTLARAHPLHTRTKQTTKKALVQTPQNSIHPPDWIPGQRAVCSNAGGRLATLKRRLRLVCSCARVLSGGWWWSFCPTPPLCTIHNKHIATHKRSNTHTQTQYKAHNTIHVVHSVALCSKYARTTPTHRARRTKWIWGSVIYENELCARYRARLSAPCWPCTSVCARAHSPCVGLIKNAGDSQQQQQRQRPQQHTDSAVYIY